MSSQKTPATLGTALITGASTGIGSVYADRLARRGYDLILVARNRTRLDAVAQSLIAATGRKITVVAADLNKHEELLGVEKILREDQSITLLVNNAGLGSASPLLDSNVDKMEEMIGLNVVALTRLTYAAVPSFVSRGNGSIIQIASVVAITPETLNGVYGATKAFVLGLTQSLQHELGAKGIRIQAVLPGATATPFWDAFGVPISNLPAEIVMSAEDLVDAALAGYDQGEIYTVPPLEDGEQYARYESARVAMMPNLSRVRAASRYGIGVAAEVV